MALSFRATSLTLIVVALAALRTVRAQPLVIDGFGTELSQLIQQHVMNQMNTVQMQTLTFIANTGPMIGDPSFSQLPMQSFPQQSGLGPFGGFSLQTGPIGLHPNGVSPGPSVVQSGLKPAAGQPGPTVIQSTPGVVHHGLNMVQPGPSVVQPGPNAVQPGSAEVQPAPGGLQLGPDAVQPGQSAILPGPGAAQHGPADNHPVPGAVQPGSNVVQSGPAVFQPTADVIHPGLNGAQPGSGAVQPGPNAIQPGPGTVQPGSNVAQSEPEPTSVYDIPEEFIRSRRPRP